MFMINCLTLPAPYSCPLPREAQHRVSMARCPPASSLPFQCSAPRSFLWAGQVSTRVPNEGRPQHRIWTKPDEGISSPFGLVSVSAFSAVGMMEVLQSHGRCGTPRKALTTAPPISVLFNPCRRRPELPRPWGASSDDQDSCIPARERIVGGSSKLCAANKTH